MVSLRMGTSTLRALGAVTLAGTLFASTADAEIVSYRKGDGKGAVSETDDTSLDQTRPNTTWIGGGEDPTIFSIDQDDEYHSLVKFPNIIGTGANQIPPGALIVNATLSLYLDDTGTDCPIVYQLTEDWTELEATWNSRHTGVAWSNAGADGPTSHKPASVGTMPCTGALAYKTLNVTASVQSWSDGEINAGWVLTNDTNNNGIDYRSSDHATATTRPELTVEFIPAVFYSVGTDASDLKTGSPTLVISSGVASLNVAQTNDIGVGDVIDFDSPSIRVYIWDVISPTQFSVQTAAGGIPAPVIAATPVNSITRAFNSVASAVTGSVNGSHLGTGNLTAIGRRLTWVCYDDTFFDVSSTTTITGYTTDASHFITLTVAGADDVVTSNSQRHLGVAGTGVRFEASAGGMNFLSVDAAFTRIEWVEFDGNDLSTTQGISLEASADSSIVRNVILHHLSGGIANSSGVFIQSGNNGSQVRNAIVYAYDSDGVHVSGTNAVIANSTFFMGRTTPASNSVQTDDAATASVYNVLAVGPETDFFENTAGGLNLYHCITEDNSAQTYDVSGNFKIGVDESTEFLSAVGSINLHLRAGAEALDFGTDLSAIFDNDIDGDTRPLVSAWDVGADESSFTTTITNYRSIGTAPDLVNQGTITVTMGSIVVTKTGGLGWLSENRGRGDVLIVGANEYVILGVVSDDELGLASPAVADYASSTYTIARQHTAFQSWYDCVDNTMVCPHFPVASSSLVADDRREVGIAYKDSVFTPPAQVLFQGAITDPAHDITLTADRGNRHLGTAGAGVVIDGQNLDRGVRVEDSNIAIEWLEFRNVREDDEAAILIRGGTGSQTGVLLQNLLIHDFFDAGLNVKGIGIQGDGGKDIIVRNTMIWDGDTVAIEGDDVTDVVTIENVTIDDMVTYGIDAFHSQFTVRNTIVTSSGTDFFVTHGDGDLSGSHNISSDGSAATHFTSSLTSIAASALFVAPNLDLHLKAGANVAVDSGLDLSASFEIDIDFHGRPAGASWDRGADERDATTAVELVSFEATPLDAAVELTWETASELNNLGFQVYRSRAYDGDYERVSPQAIPGLGSSPAGASYRYVDPGLGNGVTYFYKLEDIETTGARTFHGPVSAAPASGPEATGSSSSANTPSVVYANPEASALRVVRRSRRELVLELSTEGFSAEQQKDGSVRLVIPGFEELEENAGPDLPVKRTWIDAIAGRKVKIRSVREHEVETFAGLRPSNAEIAELVALPDGSVRLRRKARQRGRRASPRLTPESAARVVSVGFQGDGKKALVELAPLRWDEASGQLLLARRLVVRVSFQERDPAERSTDGAGRGRRYVRPRSHERQRLLARLGTTEPGLHAVRFEHLHRFRRGIPTRSLRLSRQGETVAFRVEPDPSVFEPGSVLYFVGAGAAANPFGDEAVYEIALGNDGAMMTRLSAKPSGTTASIYWHRQQWQQERFYQAALVEAPDPWLWDVVFAPGTKRFPLDVSALAPSTEPATLDVWLQGASDFDADPDHHVRISVNGTLVHELSWDGKQPRHVSAALPPGLLHDADNTVEIDNVGDTGADYSMVLLDRYALTYPRFATADDGRLESKWSTSGAAEVSGLAPGAHVVDVTDTTPRWLVDTQVSSEGVLRFHAEAGRDYLTVRPDAVYVPSVTRPRAGRLKNRLNHADYVVIGPETFLDVARPLLKLRRREGLDVLAVSLDDIYSEFGFGEATPDAIKDFLSYAYHYWKQPPRYVLLLGDATYDFHDALQTGVENRVPPRIIKTRYLWTASDPSYAAVNGDDLLPDLAIGRLPAASPDELRVMVDKILVYERSAVSFASSPMVLVADNPDHAGNFEADADELASGILSAYDPHEIYSSRLGTAATRNAIVERFDLGASLVSYIGHGGIQLWADENFFNGHDVDSLATQSRQPLLLTMNCLNGFFHFPYFDSLAEALVKADGKGAIAAFSPSGLSLNTPARLYHQALLQSLVDGRHPRLGDAILAAQSAYADTGALPELLAIYHLLGDPALRLRNK